jgi:SAM-dependent methyltransferase
VRCAPAEALALAPGSLDHALILRSFNHLEAPAAVLAQLARALRPGGRLLVVDNVAFALVRTAEQATRAERGPASFEHTRNDGAAELCAALAGLAVEVVTRQAVGPETSNQWLVEALKRG